MATTDNAQEAAGDVLLDYRLDPAEFERGRREDHVAVDDVGLRLSCFEMPVRLTAGGVDLLAYHPGEGGPLDPWLVVPILGVALELPRALREVALDGASPWEPSPLHDAAVRMRLVGADVEASPAFIEGLARVPFAALEAAAARFVRQVRADLLAAFPAFRDHPDLGPWFRGEAGDPWEDEYSPPPLPP